jgi:hypothetical protein
MVPFLHYHRSITVKTAMQATKIRVNAIARYL